MKRYQNHEAVRFSTLKELYHASAERFGDKPLFFQKQNQTYQAKSFRQYAADVDALGTALCAKGLAGKHFLLVGENRWEWAIAYMAIACGVGTVIPVNPKLSPAALAKLAKTANADVIVHNLPSDVISTLEGETLCISFDELAHLIRNGNARLAAGDRTFLETEPDADAVCTVVFSSVGTDARGVMLSQRNLCFNLFETSRMVRIDEKDRLLAVLPMHYAVQTVCGFLWPLSRGCSVVFGEGLRQLSRNLREARPTVLLGIPLLLETMYAKIRASIRRENVEKQIQKRIDFSNAIPNPDAGREAKKHLFSPLLKSFGGNLRLLISIGALTDPDVLKGWRDLGVSAIQAYEVTECAALAAINRDGFFKDLSVGMAFPDSIIDIFDMKEDGTGEIRFRGENLMKGYYNRPDLTEKVLRGGWLYTGDVGYLDEEGFLFVIGKKENAIVHKSGEEIYPEEQEWLLNRSPLVKESIVIGRANATKDQVELVAVLHLDREECERRLGNNPSAKLLDLELRRLISSINGSLPAHKRIDSFVICDEPFPKTVSHRIKRDKITATFAQC
ncbi:MAG: AMP-binding protein [Clostridia bacterium]|nr:AMP-binding protein [Clostridia bacterium]